MISKCLKKKKKNPDRDLEVVMQNRISISIYNISDNNVDCNQIDNNHMLRKDNKEYTSSNLMTGEIRILQFYLMSSETPFQYCVSSFSVKTGGHA